MLKIYMQEIVNIEELSNIFVKAYHGHPWNEHWTIENASKRLIELTSSVLCKSYIGVLNNRMIGCIIYELTTYENGKNLEIKELFIDPEYQNMGYGSMLLKKTLQQIDKSEIRKCLLWTCNHPKLISFYESEGFSIDHELIQMKNESFEMKNHGFKRTV